MKLQHLKNLSSKRLANMKAIYEKAGVSTSSINTRISTLSGDLSLEEQQAIELAAILNIEEIVDTLELDKRKLANALDMPPPPGPKSEEVPPVGYFQTTADIRPVYLIEDKVKSRYAKSGVGPPMFWTKERFADTVISNQKLTPTDRGKKYFEHQPQ